MIDPELAWSTYLGGTDADVAYGVAVDASRNVLITGWTESYGWTSGGFDTDFGGHYLPDAFVVKLSPSGGHLWSTYLEGMGAELGFGVAVDASDNVVITGRTDSAWVSGGFDTSLNGLEDAFVAKLTPLGGHVWSTYLGGSGNETGWGAAVDAQGSILITGETISAGWTLGGFDTSFNGDSDAFVAKLSSSGEHLWSTYVGGDRVDYGQGVAVDVSGNAVVTGNTDSGGWASGGFDTSHDGGTDAFVAKFGPSGQHLWSTYLGGSGNDSGWSVATDPAGAIVIAGDTCSANWVSGGFDATFGGESDAFVAKLTSAGAHLWSTY
ncbi:MAG TPA: SBBP repeat-containing protein [Planctomycetota bacterium]|nr:SBBP repeat-containing protein [Planctomycetota bacterium]